MTSLLLGALLTATALAGQTAGLDGGGVPSTVVLSIPLDRHGRIPDDAGTVAHVTFDGTKLVDSKGNVWTQQGTVPQTAQTPFYPQGFTSPPAGGAGPFSASNYYSATLASAALGGSDFYACVAFVGQPTLSRILLDAGVAGLGWRIEVGGSSLPQITVPSVASQAAGAGALVPGLNVVCAGRAGANALIKSNLAATATGPLAFAAGSGGVYLGSGRTSAATDATILEAFISTTTPSDALFTRIQQRVLGHVGSRGEPVTVTRATTATYLDPAGTLRTAPPGVLRLVSAGSRTNLATYSQRIGSTGWNVGQIGTGGSVTADAAANPVDGAMNAASVTFGTGTTGQVYTGASVAPAAGTYTLSLYAKAVGSDASFGVYLYDSSGKGFWCAATTAAWTRCSGTATVTSAASLYIGYYGGFTNPGTKPTVLLYGAQVEAGGLSDYIPTGASAVTVAQPLGALIEPAGTNLLTASAAIDGGAYWGRLNGLYPVASAAAAPDGTSTASLLTTTATTAQGYGLFQTVTYTTNPYTLSAYFKAGTYGCVTADLSNGATMGATFNLTTGTVGYTDAGVSAAITPIGGGWYRASATKTMTAGTGYPEFYFSGSCTANTRSWAPAGTETLTVWGAQLEQSPVATSYIPTTTTSASRSADAVSVANPLKASNTRWCVAGTYQPNGAWWKQSVLWNLSGAAGNNSAYATAGSDGNFYFGVYDTTATQRWVRWDTGTFAAGSTHRVTTCDAAGVLALYGDGGALGGLNGTGSGVMSVQPSTFALGYDKYAGTVKDLTVTKVATASKTAKAPPAPLLSIPFATPGCYPTGSALGTKGEPVTVSRAGTRTCNVGGTLVTCAANELCVESAGALIEPARTNLVPRSAEIENAAWQRTNAPGVTANACLAPDGTMAGDLLDFTGKPANSSVWQGPIITSSTGPFTASAWVSAAAGTSLESVQVACTSGISATGCSCTRSDGGACAVDVSSNYCSAYATVGTTPVRLTATTSCASATSVVYIGLQPGRYMTSVNTTGCYWGAQLEQGAYPTSYIPTTSGTVARNADAVSVATPGGLNGSALAVGGTIYPLVATNGTYLAQFYNGASDTINLYTTTAGRMMFDRYNGADFTAGGPAGAPWVANTSQRVTYSWLGSSYTATMCNGATCASAATSPVASSASYATIYVGNTQGRTAPLAGYLRDFRVCDISATPAPGACK